VLDGDPTPCPKRGGALPNFRPTSIVAKRLHGSRWHLVRRQASAYATLCSMRTQLPPEKRAHPPHPILVYVYCGQMAGWMKTPLGTEVLLGSGDTVLDGVPAPAKGTQQPPLFSAHLYCGHGRPSQLLLSPCI